MVHINITYNPLTDAVQIMAPLDAKVMCYGILHKAMMIVQGSQPRIAVVGASGMPKGPN